jgi:tRNA-splicing ligase RtcB
VSSESAIRPTVVPTGEATGIIETGEPGVSPVKVIGTRPIRESFDQGSLRQAVTSRLAPGVTDLVLNPDAHVGYGAPIGSVLASPTHIYPGPVGVDIKFYGWGRVVGGVRSLQLIID